MTRRSLITTAALLAGVAAGLAAGPAFAVATRGQSGPDMSGMQINGAWNDCSPIASPEVLAHCPDPYARTIRPAFGPWGGYAPARDAAPPASAERDQRPPPAPAPR